MEMQDKCYFCNETNQTKSLEHAIPQFLFGTKSPDKFKKLSLCKKCNSELGLHIDGRFARSFLIATELRKISYTDKNILQLPNLSKKIDDDKIKEILNEDEDIEMILLNQGLLLFWVKKNSYNFQDLVGGHPIKSKSNLSQIYLFFQEKSQQLNKQDIINGVVEVCEYFKNYKKIEILICLEFMEDELSELSEQGKQDLENSIQEKATIKFLWHFNDKEKELMNLLKFKREKEVFSSRSTLYLNDLYRFSAKLFLGFISGYLGKDFPFSAVGKNLIKIMKTYNMSNRNRLNINKFYISIEKNEKPTNVDIFIININSKIFGFLVIGQIKIRIEICSMTALNKNDLEKLNISTTSINLLSRGLVLTYDNNLKTYCEMKFDEFILKDKKLTNNERNLAKITTIIP